MATTQTTKSSPSVAKPKNLHRNLILFIVFGTLVFFAFGIYGDLTQVTLAFRRFELGYLPLILALALTNYLLRFVRWHLYLGCLDIPLPKGPSLLIFLAGFVMSLTPGKAGELLKAYLVKLRLGTPISKCAPAVLVERLLDFLAFAVLSLVGLYSFSKWMPHLLAVLFVLLAVVIIFGNTSAGQFLWKLQFLRRFKEPLQRTLGSMQNLLTFKNLLWSLPLSTLSWFAHGVLCYYVIIGLGGYLPLLDNIFIFCASTLFGALTLLPGGLGSTEASMSGLYTLQNISLPDAIAATFIIRVCSLWFAIALGLLAFLPFQKQIKFSELSATE